MSLFVFIDSFASYHIVLSSILLISTLWYFWFVYRPYAAFPAYRLEHRIPIWILKRIPLNYAAIHGLIEQARRYESEGVLAVWIGVPYLFVYGEDIVKMIVQEPAATDKPGHYKLFEHQIGKGIFTSNGDLYKKHWKMAVPAFQSKALKTYTTIMNRHSEEMIKRLFELKGQQTDDIINIVSFSAIGVIFDTNLGGKEINLEEILHITNTMNKAIDFLNKRMWIPWLFSDFMLHFIPSARENKKLGNSLLNENLKPRLEIIKESLLSRKISPHADDPDVGLYGRRLKPIGETFVEQHLRDPTITMDEVTRQLSVIYVAAFDTIVHTMQFTLCMLGTNKDVQDRAFKEVMSITEGHVTYDDLQRLTYLECVIKETLRLYPPPIFGRYLRKNLQCGKYKIPQNTTIAVFPYMLHRNPEIYPDPEKFDPRRFMDKNSKIKPWNYVAFAEGLRPCIGKRFALNEMKIMLAHVLRNFEIISLDRFEEKDLTWNLLLESTKKLRLQFLPRT